jgi:hypothetical protein
MDLDKLKNKFSEILKTKKPVNVNESAGKVLGESPTPTKTLRIEIRGINLSNINLENPRQQYMRRSKLRRSMLEGTIDYPSLSIAPIRKSDIFSMGILFTEMETALNSNSIFKRFSEIPKDKFGMIKMKQVLHDGINKTFEMKMTRNTLSRSLIPDIKDFFKTNHDMQVSFKQYSSEYKSVHGNHMSQFNDLLEKLKELLLKMTSYYAYDRPNIDEVQSVLNELRDGLEQIRKSNKIYRNSINIINRRIRATEASMLKQRYISIYGKDSIAKRLLI